MTAVTALQRPDGVEYRFASNQRKDMDRERMKDFVTDLLKTISPCTEATTMLVTVRVLSKVILFNRSRLRSSYVDKIAKHASTCLETEDLPPVVRENLTELQRLATDAKAQDEAACE